MSRFILPLREGIELFPHQTALPAQVRVFGRLPDGVMFALPSENEMIADQLGFDYAETQPLEGGVWIPPTRGEFEGLISNFYAKHVGVRSAGISPTYNASEDFGWGRITLQSIRGIDIIELVVNLQPPQGADVIWEEIIPLWLATRTRFRIGTSPEEATQFRVGVLRHGPEFQQIVPDELLPPHPYEIALPGEIFVVPGTLDIPDRGADPPTFELQPMQWGHLGRVIISSFSGGPNVQNFSRTVTCFFQASRSWLQILGITTEFYYVVQGLKNPSVTGVTVEDAGSTISVDASGLTIMVTVNVAATITYADSLTPRLDIDDFAALAFDITLEFDPLFVRVEDVDELPPEFWDPVLPPPP